MGLIKTMPIGQDKTRVGIITYNSDVSFILILALNRCQNYPDYTLYYIIIVINQF